MAEIKWDDSDEPVDLGAIDGYTFRPRTPAEPREAIVVPKEISVSLTGTFTVPDDSPIWRAPWCMAANARNN